MAEVEAGKQPIVHALAEAATSVDVVAEAVHLVADHPNVAALVAELSDLMQQTHSSARRISFALPTQALFIATLPVDPSLKEKDLNEHLQWELQQYFPDAGPKDFITDAYVLPFKQNDARLIFLVAVRRGVVAFLQHVAAQLQVKLHIIDVDHFSTEKTLMANYPENKKTTVALIGVQRSVVDASLVRNHEMVNYRSYGVSSASSLGSTFADYLQYIKSSGETQSVKCLYLHGSQVPTDALTTLSTETGVEIVPMNALRKLTVAESVDTSLAAESHRFAAAIGVALRTS
jgi:Tfp pilus assembly PilM family ATPase